MNQLVSFLCLLFVCFNVAISSENSGVSVYDHENETQPIINSRDRSLYFILQRIHLESHYRGINLTRDTLIHGEFQINCHSTRDRCFDDLEDRKIQNFTANFCLISGTMSDNMDCRFLKLSRNKRNYAAFDVMEEKSYQVFQGQNISTVVHRDRNSAANNTVSPSRTLDLYPFFENGQVSLHTITFATARPIGYLYFQINALNVFVLSFIVVEPNYEKFDDIRRTHLCYDPTDKRTIRILNRNANLGRAALAVFFRNPFAGVPLSLNVTYPGIIPGDLPFADRFRDNDCFQDPLIPTLLNGTKTKLEAEIILQNYFQYLSSQFCFLYLCPDDFCVTVRDLNLFMRDLQKKQTRSLEEINPFSDSILANRLHVSGDILKKKFGNLIQQSSSPAASTSSHVPETLQNVREPLSFKTGEWRRAQSIKVLTEDNKTLPEDSRRIQISQETLPDDNLEKLSQGEVFNTTNKEKRFQHKILHLNRSRHAPFNKRFTHNSSINDFKETFHQKLNKRRNSTLEIRNETLSPIVSLSDKIKKSRHEKKNAENNASIIPRFNNRLNSLHSEKNKANSQLNYLNINASTHGSVRENRQRIFHLKNLNFFNGKNRAIYVLNGTDQSRDYLATVSK